MKVTFFYKNGKTFTASNVQADTLEVSKDNSGNKIVEYTQVVEPSAEAFNSVVSLLAPTVPPFAESGIKNSLYSDTFFYSPEFSHAVTIDATKAELLFMIVKPQESDYDGVTNWDDSKALVFIPVLESINPLVMVDALKTVL